MESTPLPENRRAIPWHWIVLGLLVVVHAGVGAWLKPIGMRSAHPFSSMFVGFFLSQPALFALWAAFAPQRFYQRWLWSLLLCILVSFSVDIGILRQTNDQLGVIMLADLALFIPATLALLIVRRYFGWQFTRSGESIGHSDYQVNQYGIKHLILLMTISAFGLGLLRTLVLMAPSFSIATPLEYALGIVFLFAMLLPVIILAWFIMANHDNIVYSVSRLIIWPVCIDMIVLLSSSFLRTGVPIEHFLFAQLGAALSVLVTTLVMRWCGFRMIRVSKKSAPAGEA